MQVKATFRPYMERRERPVSDETPHGRTRYRNIGRRCDVCKESNKIYMRELRARKREPHTAASGRCRKSDT